MKWLAFALWTLLLPVMAVSPAPDLTSQGDYLKTQGDLKGAISDYTQAIAQDPKNVRAYLGRASVLSLQGDYKGAIVDDTKAIALDPKNAVAFGNRGNARTSQGDLSGALADYTQAITLDPHHVHAFINRGNVKNLQKKYSEALADYNTAITLDPKNAAAYYDRGGVKKALRDFDGAMADYSEAIKLNPVDVPAYINRAVLEMTQKKWNDATDDLTKCLSLLPPERQAYPRIYLWIVWAKQGKSEQATRELTQQTNLVPKTLSATWGGEIAKFLTGQVTEPQFLASATSFQATKDKGQKAQSYYYAGLKREIAGDRAGATKLFQRCMTAGNPSLHEYILAREEIKGVHP